MSSFAMPTVSDDAKPGENDVVRLLSESSWRFCHQAVCPAMQIHAATSCSAGLLKYLRMHANGWLQPCVHNKFSCLLRLLMRHLAT
mmetsp:Transcript_41429/g.76284  ORF Transcript_41429/g.76284 Transcript_41429/m.76284 type:complete len:86 (-) Transcript_41429:699-956(-)